MPTITSQDLTAFSRALLTAGGFNSEEAHQMADLLVWANLRGKDSHGVLRIPRYIEMLEQGLVTSGGKPVFVKEFGAVAVLDGGRCPGAIGMNIAVEKAAELARKFGLGLCSAKAISHAGAIGYFAEALAAKGQVGLVMTASRPLMAYTGAKGEALSTNPLAISVPVNNAEPITLDMSTSAVALGKIMAAKDTGDKLQKGWAIDETGAETTDPHRVAAVLPMAGAKGSGLSLMIEILTSVLAGNPVIAPVLLGRKKGGFNGLIIAIDPNAFGSVDDFTNGTVELAEAIHALPPADGVEAVLLPGERGAKIVADRSAGGIPLARGTAERLARVATKLGVEVPVALR